MLLHHVGKLEEAEPLLRSTNELLTLVLGPEHDWTLTSMFNLARLLHDIGENADGDELMQRALESRKRAYGSKHPHCRRDAALAAESLLSRGEIEEAEMTLNDVLFAGGFSADYEGRRLLSALHDCAEALQEQGEYARAEKMLRKAMEFLDEDDALRRIVQFSHADILLDMDRPKEAYSTLENLLEIEQRELGIDHIETAMTHYLLAYTLRKLGRHKEAIHHRQRSLEIEEAHQGLQNPDTLETVCALAEDLVASGQNEEARSLLTRALSAAADSEPEDPESLREVNEEMEQLLSSLDEGPKP